MDDEAAVAEAAVAPLATEPPEGALALDPPPPPLDEKYFSKGSFGFFCFPMAPVALLDDVLGGATLLVLLATDTELGGNHSVAL